LYFAGRLGLAKCVQKDKTPTPHLLSHKLTSCCFAGKPARTPRRGRRPATIRSPVDRSRSRSRSPADRSRSPADRSRSRSPADRGRSPVFSSRGGSPADSPARADRNRSGSPADSSPKAPARAAPGVLLAALAAGGRRNPVAQLPEFKKPRKNLLLNRRFAVTYQSLLSNNFFFFACRHGCSSSY